MEAQYNRLLPEAGALEQGPYSQTFMFYYLTNGRNKLECCITLRRKGLPVRNTLVHRAIRKLRRQRKVVNTAPVSESRFLRVYSAGSLEQDIYCKVH